MPGLVPGLCGGGKFEALFGGVAKAFNQSRR